MAVWAGAAAPTDEGWPRLPPFILQTAASGGEIIIAFYRWSYEDAERLNTWSESHKVVTGETGTSTGLFPRSAAFAPI